MNFDHIPHPDADIMHYGVKGMQWGVRKREERGPTRREKRAEAKKLIARSDMSTSTDKALNRPAKELSVRKKQKIKEFERYADRQQSLIDKSKSIPVKNLRQGKYLEKQQKNYAKERDRANADAKAIRTGGLTTQQKKLLKGAAIAGGLVAAYGAYRVVETGEFNRLMMKGSAFIGGKESPFKMNSDLAKKGLSIDQLQTSVISKINPNYGGARNVNNCRRCTFAYELRRRGYDVQATQTFNGMGQTFGGLYNATLQPGESRVGSSRGSLLSKFAKESAAGGDSRFLDMMNSGGLGIPIENSGSRSMNSSIFDALKKQPDGARGELGIMWKPGGGHSVAWEIVGGKPVIFDTQSGRTYRNAAEMARDLGGDPIATAGFTRLDNIPLNEDFLLRWVKNV